MIMKVNQICFFTVKAKYGDVALDEDSSSEEEDEDAEVCVLFFIFIIPTTFLQFQWFDLTWKSRGDVRSKENAVADDRPGYNGCAGYFRLI